MSKTQDIFDKLAAEETEFFDGKVTFFSPILSGRKTQISTRIAGVEYTFPMALSTKRASGWYVFRAVGHSKAKILREATFEEVEAYKKLFTIKRIILVQQAEDHWLGLLTNSKDGEEEIVRLFLSDNVELFDYVDAIKVGSVYWFCSTYTRRDPILLDNLRQSFLKEVKTPKITGLSPDENKAYSIASALRIEANKSNTQLRLEKALAKGKASLVSYKEQGDLFVVEWEFDGHRRTSSVRSADLTIQSAGICLSNTDQRFDLTTLPSVFREKLRRHGSFEPYHGRDDYDD